MHKNLAYLIAFAMVICLIPIVVSAGIDEGLVAYWPLDEGAGDTTSDVSGNGSDGTLNGGPTWTEGKLGGALDFDGNDDYVDCGNPTILDFSTNDFTISAWAKTTDPGGDFLVYSKGGDSGGGIRYELMFRDNSGGDARILVDDDNDKYDPDTGDKQLSDGQWHHLVAMRRNGTELRMYVDGVEDQGLTGHGESTIPADYDLSGTSQHNAHIAANYHHGNNEVQKFFSGLIDDVAIWNRAITEEEIAFLWNDGNGNPVSVSTPGLASNPFPEDGTNDVVRDVNLMWTPGFANQTHTVYLSETFDDVNDAVNGTSQNAATFDPGRLAFDQTYYWRVDEVNGAPDNTVFEGAVWSFTVEPAGLTIENITATASAANPDMGPENTINGSGLNEQDQHSSTPNDMWLADGDSIWIQYEFDKVYKLQDMLVWNSNQQIESFIGFGIKEATIETSTDGEAWTVLDAATPFAQATGFTGYAANTTMDMAGAVAKYVKITANSAYGTIGQMGLSEVRFRYIPNAPRAPQPADQATVASVDVQLGWRSGREAASHQVSMGTNPDNLAVVDTTTENVLVTDALDYDTTYYWSVTEVNEAQTPATYTGDIWSFITPPFGSVDDMESFSGKEGEEVFLTWLDGFGGDASLGGSITGHIESPFVETGSVNSGGQSLPVFYDNDGGFFDIDGNASAPTFSEVLRVFDSPQDWTTNGIKSLSIMFSGAPGNTGQLYCKIGNTKLVYDGDAANLSASAWQAWNIDLSTVGGNLTSVRELAIGIDGGGSGVLYLDDIRLYAQVGEVITPVEPDNANLLAYYAFEGNANDSSGNGLNGTIADGQIVSPGKLGVGSSVQLSQAGYVDLGNPSALNVGTGDWTVTAWYNTAITGTGDENKGTIYANGGDGAGGHRYALIMSESNEGSVSLICDDDAAKIQAHSTSVTNDAEWHFVAGQRDGLEIHIFIDGQLEDSDTLPDGYDLSGTSQNNAYIGAITYTPDSILYKLFLGFIDEVQVHSRALSAEEILWLAGKTKPAHKPF
jgi:hypothetical protein